jgi:hypothetical protein
LFILFWWYWELLFLLLQTLISTISQSYFFI